MGAMWAQRAHEHVFLQPGESAWRRGKEEENGGDVSAEGTRKTFSYNRAANIMQ